MWFGRVGLAVGLGVCRSGCSNIAFQMFNLFLNGLHLGGQRVETGDLDNDILLNPLLEFFFKGMNSVQK